MAVLVAIIKTRLETLRNSKRARPKCKSLNAKIYDFTKKGTYVEPHYNELLPTPYTHTHFISGWLYIALNLLSQRSRVIAQPSTMTMVIELIHIKRFNEYRGPRPSRVQETIETSRVHVTSATVHCIFKTMFQTTGRFFNIELRIKSRVQTLTHSITRTKTLYEYVCMQLQTKGTLGKGLVLKISQGCPWLFLLFLNSLPLNDATLLHCVMWDTIFSSIIVNGCKYMHYKSHGMQWQIELLKPVQL